ncbi:MAG TPA: helix-turn-helix domain-containing protein [Spirochaetia bacterium]|nr:helix-turn-helix domain-containing protein [Spirochaetia bacterium]
MAEIPARQPTVDIALLKKLGAEYRAATALPLLLVDPLGRRIWSLGACPLCARLGSSRRLKKICCDYERLAVEESLRWGEPYISACPLGLVTFAVPLSREKRLIAGLVSGFSILPQMETDIREEVTRSIRRLRLRGRTGSRLRFSFRVVPSETLRRDANLLFELTGRYGANDLELIHESHERSIQQFTIANFIHDARKEKQDLVSSLVRMQNEIIDKVVLGDLSGSREIINRYLGAILLETGMNFSRLKVRLLELIVIISRAAIEKGISADGLLGPRYSYLTDINAAEGFDDLFWKVTTVLENFNRTVSEEIGRKAWAHMTRMRDYVQKHFTEKVSAANVAAAAGLSVSRALHLFRIEGGTSLSAYIARQRIDFSKYLLSHTHASIASIASDCGFFDQSHFSKTFAALEGIPPLRYRTRIRGSG